jgi:hypothetical protein
MERRLSPAREVAVMLGRSKALLDRHRARPEAEHGFPAPVAAVGLRWDVLAIEAWLDGPSQKGRQGPGLRTAAECEAALLERAAAMAPSHPMCGESRSAASAPAAAAARA